MAQYERTLPPPPRNFTAVQGLQWAIIVGDSPSFIKPKRKPTGRRLQGVKYEALVVDYVMKDFAHCFVPGLWLKFQAASGLKWCQPDGLLFDFQRGIITIVEVKYQHTTDAWWQMRRLYLPVLEKLFPPHLWKFRMLEIVKWYDPFVPWPEGIQLIPNLGRVHTLEENCTGVHIWKP